MTPFSKSFVDKPHTRQLQQSTTTSTSTATTARALFWPPHRTPIAFWSNKVWLSGSLDLCQQSSALLLGEIAGISCAALCPNQETMRIMALHYPQLELFVRRPTIFIEKNPCSCFSVHPSNELCCEKARQLDVLHRSRGLYKTSGCTVHKI